MPYDYNSTSSLVHARNFKYIKREPDGKGGWRYYYDVKKHGADIKRNFENKTGIAARNRMNDAKKKYDTAQGQANEKKYAATEAKKRYDSYMNISRDVREQQKAGINITWVGAHTNALARAGEEYRDKSIAADKTTKEAEVAKKEYKSAQEKYNNIPMVKLSKEVKAGANKVSDWLKTSAEKTADKLGVDEHAKVKEAYAKKTDAAFEKNAANASYQLAKELKSNSEAMKINEERLKNTTKKHDDALTKFNAARDEYFNTPLGKLDKASGHFKEDGEHFFNEYFEKKYVRNR